MAPETTEPGPERSAPSTTVNDASEAVARVLDRSRAAAPVARAVADALRAAVSIAIGVVAWSRMRAPLGALLDRAIAAWARDLVLAAAPLLVGALAMTLACRLTTKRFVHPLRRRRS